MEGAPTPKRMRLAYSSGGKSKACIIFYCFEACRGFSHIGRLECNVCIVDLKSDALVGGTHGDGGDDYDDDAAGFARVCPTLQIDYGGRDLVIEDAFCVLGEKLYIFEEYDGDGAVKNSVFAFDLESSSSSPSSSQTLALTAKKSEKGGPFLEKIGDMLSPKTGPAALPTPDGKKIVVFSTGGLTESPLGDFELFDPSSPGSPERLPPIAGTDMLSIEQYGFIPGSDKLAVKVFALGIYVLDLSSPDGGRDWAKMGPIYADVELVPPNTFFPAPPSFFETVEGGRFCFVNRFGFFDLEEFAGGRGEGDDDNDGGGARNAGFVIPKQKGFALGRSRRDQRRFDADFRVARCLNDEEERDGKYHVCNLVMERLSEYVGFCRMELNVCRVDLKSYEEEEAKGGDGRLSLASKVANTTLVKKHKLSLDFGGRRHLRFGPHLFFTF